MPRQENSNALTTTISPLRRNLKQRQFTGVRDNSITAKLEFWDLEIVKEVDAADVVKDPGWIQTTFRTIPLALDAIKKAPWISPWGFFFFHHFYLSLGWTSYSSEDYLLSAYSRDDLCLVLLSVPLPLYKLHAIQREYHSFSYTSARVSILSSVSSPLRIAVLSLLVTSLRASLSRAP